MTQQAIPRVSIGLPVYNGERYLAEAVDSILAQTFTDFELIISDNGSTDATEAMCRAYAAQDDRVRYHRYDENRGAAWNFNNAFALARADYFKWACYDDTITPDLLEKCVPVLDKDPDIVLCYPRTTIIDDDGNIIGLWADNLETHDPRPHRRLRHYWRNKSRNEAQYGVFRRQVLAKTGLMGTIRYSDQVLMAEMMLRGYFRELPDYDFHKRFHEGISTEAYKSAYSYAKFMNTAKNAKVGLPRLKRLAEFFKGIRRSRLGVYHSLRCYIEMGLLACLPTNWLRMVEDIYGAARHSLQTAAARRVKNS